MNVETLHDLFLFETQRLYAIETRLADELATLERDAGVDALDGLQETDARETLREVLAEHETETRTHAERLEEVLDALGRTPDSRSTRDSQSAPALEGLVEEKERFNNVVLNDQIRPLFYVGTARQIEQMEITAYEQLLEIGDHLDVPDEVIDRLERNLEEDEATLRTLESITDGEDGQVLLEELGDSTVDD